MKTSRLDQSGFTLIQLVAGLGIPVIWGLLLLSIGTGVFSKPEPGRPITELKAPDDDSIFDELREAAILFVQDVRMAVNSDLVDGGAPVSSVTFLLVGDDSSDDSPHMTRYSLDGDSLTLTDDGRSQVLARKLRSASFSRSGNEIRATFEVQAGPATTRTLAVDAQMNLR